APAVWLNGYGPGTPDEPLASRPDLRVQKFQVGDPDKKDSFRFVTDKVLGDFDVHFTDGFDNAVVTLPECLLMLHCARSTALKPGYQPPRSAADLTKFGWELDKNEASGKIVGVTFGVAFGEAPCTDATL